METRVVESASLSARVGRDAAEAERVPATSRMVSEIFGLLDELERIRHQGRIQISQLADPINRLDHEGPFFAPKADSIRQGKEDETQDALLARLANVRNRVGDMIADAQHDLADAESAYARLNSLI